MRITFRRALRTTWSLTPAVAGVTALAVVSVLIGRQLLLQAVLQRTSDAVGNYLQTLGGIYAVLLAFVTAAVWSQFNDARGYVAREAAAVVDVFRTVSGLSTERAAAVMTALQEYVRAVIDEEWQAMANDDDAIMERTGQKLDDVWLAIVACEPKNSDSELFGEVISRFNELTELRTQRLTAARTQLPLALRILLYAGAIIVNLSMLLLYVESIWIHMFMTGAMAACISHVLYVIVDLDDAFDGDWRVAPAAFLRTQRALARLQSLASVITLARGQVSNGA